ncbi:MAG: hypothetical protein DSM106950_10315 [Stigonema ocellatum SAG 48.90 = DSM 106950]|nr:hypothetical protein [Stigonema ocellatum SAG 48.90 = DSM 106950]
MKGKLSAIIAGTMLAVTGATLPASAIVSSTIGQQQIGVQQETLLLAAKDNTVKGGHSKITPTKKEKHQNGEARRNQDQNVNPAFKAYKKKGGKLDKHAWEKAGRPTK